MQRTLNKERRWLEVQDTVSRISDTQGKPVDAGIAKALTGLLAYSFPTEGSCEGHLDYGVKAPWIDVGKNLPARYIALFKRKGLPHKPGRPPHVDDVFAAYPALWELRTSNMRLLRRLRALLRAFYRTHQSFVPDAELVIVEQGCYGMVRLISHGADYQDTRTFQQQAEYLRFYQQEMQTFAEFLKKRYFQATSRPRIYESTALLLSAIA